MTKILLVEDNAGDAALARHMLNEPGADPYEVDHVERLDEARRALARKPFDAILLDLSLPDSLGKDTLRGMQEAAPDLPIVVLTGYGDESLLIEPVREGAQDYLVKGQWDSQVLRRAIRYTIDRKRMELEVKRVNRELAEAQMQPFAGKPRS